MENVFAHFDIGDAIEISTQNWPSLAGELIDISCSQMSLTLNQYSRSFFNMLDRIYFCLEISVFNSKKIPANGFLSAIIG